MPASRVTILGVPIDVLTLPQAADRIESMAKSEAQHHVVTPNPEMIVAAGRDPVFKEILTASALNIPDGVGLLWAARYLGTIIPQRVTGIDVLTTVCGSSHSIGPVFLLGAAPGVAEKAAAVLLSKNPSLVISGTYAGSPAEHEEEMVRAKINASGAKVLFVAYGAPKQDLWIARNLAHLPHISVAMGVGGSFDFLTGIQKRAPKVLRSMGLEWLWRLLHEPKRALRIFTAVVVFPLLVIRSRFI